jgi:hypothetical protein
MIAIDKKLIPREIVKDSVFLQMTRLKLRMSQNGSATRLLAKCVTVKN